MLPGSPIVRRAVLGAAAFAALAACVPVGAQTAWPARPLTFVVPYTAGGAADVFARQFAEKLAARLGQPVVVDNRGGANGNLGSVSVVRAPADGYTLLLGTQSTIAINPPLYGERMPYDPAKDLAPVSTTHAMSHVLVVPAASPHKTLAELVAAAKAKPGTLAYASAGVGNTQHIAGEMLAVLQEPAMRQSLEQQGFEVIPSTPAQFADLIRSDMPRMRELVQRSGAKAD